MNIASSEKVNKRCVKGEMPLNVPLKIQINSRPDVGGAGVQCRDLDFARGA
jgi:hypothetical protein